METQSVVPDQNEMEELTFKMQRGDLSKATRVRFMRGAVYFGSLQKGKTEFEAIQLAQHPDVEKLGENLTVKVE